MSVTVSNCNQICNSPTNTSKAKMLYSFKKQSRFPKKLRIMCDNFYELPHHSGRSTSLGYGHKYDFTKNTHKSPPPNAYQIGSDFDKNIKKGTGFGEGRQQMAVTGPFVYPYKNKNPGPGNYQMKSGLNKTCYSMSGKNYRIDKQRLKTPGPGSYDSGLAFSPVGKYFLAKHKNSCVRNFNHFAGRGSTLHTIMTPGPGNYDNQGQQMSPQGKYFVSKMHNSLARRFGTSIRQPIAPKKNTPGPGQYRLPSQFGHYQAKNALQAKASMSGKQNDSINEKNGSSSKGNNDSPHKLNRLKNQDKQNIGK